MKKYPNGTILKLTHKTGGGLMGFRAGQLVEVSKDERNANDMSLRVIPYPDDAHAHGGIQLVGYVFLDTEFEIIKEAK